MIFIKNPCCCDPVCPPALIDFDDETFGPYSHDGATPPWSVTDTEHPNKLVLQDDGEASLLWTVPITDNGKLAYYGISADVEGDSATDSNGGGVTIKGSDWQVWWWIEGGVLHLKWEDADQTIIKSTGSTISTPRTLSLTVATRRGCPGYTIVTAISNQAGENLSMLVAHDIEVTLPANVEMGVYAPVDLVTPPANGFQACCEGHPCTGKEFEATGTVEPLSGTNPCGVTDLCVAGTTTVGAWSTDDILCGGVSITGTLTDFNPADGYYLGAFPFSGYFGNWDGWKLLLYCAPSGLAAAAIDASNCVAMDFGLLSGGPCGGTITWDDPENSCFDDGANNCFNAGSRFTIAITETGECEGSHRVWDNVELAACGGYGGAPQECNPPEIDSPDCSLCQPTVARCWRTVLSGITPDGIHDAECDCRDREFIFDHESPDVSPECFPRPQPDVAWLLCDIGGIPGNYKSATLSLDGALTEVTVAFVMGFSEDSTQYSIAANEFDCNGPNVLTLSQIGPGCDNWPATITVEPWECLAVD